MFKPTLTCPTIIYIVFNDLFSSTRDSVIRKVVQDYAKDHGASFKLIWRWMIEHGAANAHIDSDGNTALHVAAKMGITAAVEHILETCSCKSE